MTWDPLEIAAVLLGLACVGLTVREHIACWPTGLAMVTLYIFIFYRAKLYSDMLLQVVYIFLQIYGWYAWLHGGPASSRLPVSTLPAGHGVRWLAVCVLGTLALGGAMKHYTDAALPYIDAFATTASLVAQWLMGRKVLQSWLVWIVVDVVSIGMYAAKALYPTAGLYVLFLALATLGFFTWKRSLVTAAAA
jgi:nicotinamide mononucleotide transporter